VQAPTDIDIDHSHFDGHPPPAPRSDPALRRGHHLNAHDRRDEDPQISAERDRDRVRTGIRERDGRARERGERAAGLATTASTTTIRGSVGEGNDGEAIRGLAARSGRQAPQGAVLLAEVNGDPVAAIGIADGHAVAHPAHATLPLRIRLRLERLFVRLVIAMGGA
jgi:hypothetical protein